MQYLFLIMENEPQAYEHIISFIANTGRGALAVQEI
jgi:hypothetical protein